MRSQELWQQWEKMSGLSSFCAQARLLRRAEHVQTQLVYLGKVRLGHRLLSDVEGFDSPEVAALEWHTQRNNRNLQNCPKTNTGKTEGGMCLFVFCCHRGGGDLNWNTLPWCAFCRLSCVSRCVRQTSPPLVLRSSIKLSRCRIFVFFLLARQFFSLSNARILQLSDIEQLRDPRRASRPNTNNRN